MNKRRELIKFVLSFLCPTIFLYFGQATLTDTILISFKMQPESIKRIKDFCYLIGIVLTLYPLLSYCKYAYENYHVKKQQIFLICQVKEYILISLKTILGRDNLNINIRIFTPRCKIFKSLFTHFRKREYFVMRNIPGFTDDDMKSGLSFEVKHKPQGLVGQCYKTGFISYDKNFQDSPFDYNLTKYQRMRTRDIKFWVCVPLFNEKDEISAIMSFDSDVEIELTKRQANIVFPLLDKFSREFFDNMPTLFK